MPIHDWTRVGAGTFHHLHNLWMGRVSDALNDGILPADYYAMVEQITDGVIPDVLTLQANGTAAGSPPSSGAVLTVSATPPRVRMVAQQDVEQYVSKQKSVVVRESDGDRVVAVIEIVSAGNKASRHAIRAFVEKAAAAISPGIHLLVIDLQPPTKRDPHGIHATIWEEWTAADYAAPPDKPLTLVSYCAGPPVTAYIEPVAVGDELTEMPLFLTADDYVPVPLEATYGQAYRSVPLRWRHVLEGA